MRAAPTASLQLPHIVTGEPPGLAVAGPFPPAPVILSDHSDDVALGEGELVLIGLLESKARLEQRVATPTALGHSLQQPAQHRSILQGGLQETLRIRDAFLGRVQDPQRYEPGHRLLG
ncbi:hypothetical protein F7725_009038 [Dissostichus mawsoni]|uniref:Uncharacterized protein n=1 Tax=Dissostichus mawsoni TaxID=36200 RepID=A0A7J5Z7W3_DISMA|nr:hypothetical protein F7725_009038 [Dissostichus mawsoni]